MKVWKTKTLETFPQGLGEIYGGNIYDLPYIDEIWKGRGKIERGHIVEFVIIRNKDKKRIHGIMYKVNNFGNKYYKAEVEE